MYSLARSLNLPTYLLARSLARLLTYRPAYLLACRLPTYSLARSLAYLPTSTCSLASSLTYPPYVCTNCLHTSGQRQGHNMSWVIHRRQHKTPTRQSRRCVDAKRIPCSKHGSINLQISSRSNERASTAPSSASVSNTAWPDNAACSSVIMSLAWSGLAV